MSEAATPALKRSLHAHLSQNIYKDLLEIHTDHSGVSIKIRETREGIEELLFIADEDKSLFVLSITGFMTFKEAAALAGSVDLDAYIE